jgi:hypothetical protein
LRLKTSGGLAISIQAGKGAAIGFWDGNWERLVSVTSEKA